MTNVIPQSVHQLKDAVKGPVLHPGDAAYTAARRVFNMRFSGAPTTIVRVTDVEDVVAVTRYAAENDLPFAVRSGGHGVDGHAMPDDALVIDTSLLKRISVDPHTNIARVQSGVLLGELDAAMQAHGRVVPSGTVSTTGVAGLTLGGGVGNLMRRFGATVDNLVACDMVTVDGRVERASEQDNPELFWALRGAGANLGVVTTFEYRTHELGSQLSSGLIVYPADRAAEVLHGLAEHMRTAPRELSMIVSLSPSPRHPAVPEPMHGNLALILVVTYTGDPALTDRVIDPLLRLGPPVANLVAPTSWVQANSILDVIAPYGHRVHTRGGYLDELSDEVVALMVAGGRRAPGPAGVYPHFGNNLYCFGGAFSEDFDEDSVAFSREGARWLWEAVASWEGPENDSMFVDWVDGEHRAVKPHLRSNSYVNLSMDQGPEWRRQIYGSAKKCERVVAAKTAWDPHNRLRFNKNVEPAAIG